MDLTETFTITEQVNFDIMRAAMYQIHGLEFGGKHVVFVLPLTGMLSFLQVACIGGTEAAYRSIAVAQSSAAPEERDLTMDLPISKVDQVTYLDLKLSLLQFGVPTICSNLNHFIDKSLPR